MPARRCIAWPPLVVRGPPAGSRSGATPGPPREALCRPTCPDRPGSGAGGHLAGHRRASAKLANMSRRDQPVRDGPANRSRGRFPERRGASGRPRRAVTPTAASRAQLRTEARPIAVEAREAQRAGGQRASGTAASIMASGAGRGILRGPFPRRGRGCPAVPWLPSQEARARSRDGWRLTPPASAQGSGNSMCSGCGVP